MGQYVVAALIAAGPASLSAFAAFQTMRRTKTNHGKTIGQHVEAQGEKVDTLLEWADSMTTWAVEHTAQDAEQNADLRARLGMPAKPYITRPLVAPDQPDRILR